MPDMTDRPDGFCTGWLETSVNWDDDKCSVTFTRAQRSAAGNILNPHGVARLRLSDLQNCCKVTRVESLLNYERAVEDRNSYHGNILFSRDVPKQVLRMIAGTIGLVCEVVDEPTVVSASSNRT